MAKSKQTQIADIIMSMTYSELLTFCEGLVMMQTSLKEDTNGHDQWKTDELYGSNGLMKMMYSWAEACD